MEKRFDSEIDGLDMDSLGEDIFYRLLVDYEIGSMVKKIETQHRVKTVNWFYPRRIDFVLTTHNGEKIYIEIDGSIHRNPFQKLKDFLREIELQNKGIKPIHFTNSRIMNYPEEVANEITGLIELTETF